MAYEEAQQEQFCGIHAVNMLFQERKLVWFKGCPELLYRELLGPVDEANERYKIARERVQVAEAALGEKERELELFMKDKTPIKKGKKPTYSKENTESIQPLFDALAAVKAENKAATAAKKKAFKALTDEAEEADADAEAEESGVLTPNVCFNMAHLCDNLLQMAENADAFNVESSCTFEDLGYNGQIPYNVLVELISGSLNYDIDYGMPNDLEQFDTQFSNPNCIGVLVNFKHPELYRHYGAIVKYPGSEGIVWADSAAEPILTPLTVSELKSKLMSMRDEGALNLLLFVLAKEDSAPTVALERLHAAASHNTAPPNNVKGGTRRRRSMKKRTRRYRRNRM